MKETDIEELGKTRHISDQLYMQEFDSDHTKAILEQLPTIEKLRAECDEFNKAEAHRPAAEFLAFVEDIIQASPETSKDVEKKLITLRKKYKKECSKSTLLAAYRQYIQTNSLPRSRPFEEYLIKKSVRSSSGVLVITVFTSPYPSVNGKVQRFSCEYDCHYCPNEPSQPRSYLLNEPGVRRANMNGFDAVRQFHDRLENLIDIGHEADKIEVLVLGGTWTSYPIEYQESFCRDLYYAANVFGKNPRERLSIAEEIIINSTSSLRIIGLTLETRPDTINPTMLRRLRSYGTTRIQLGIQHISDEILKKVNRRCYLKDFVKATRLLKDSCFKIDIHLMPDLPGATPELDLWMFRTILNDSRLAVDQWKIYPCQTVPFTKIREWFEEGEYRPYGHEGLVKVLVYAMCNVQPWIRLNRVIRDIPCEYILGGTRCTNLRQVVENTMRKNHLKCACIRCREVKDNAGALKLAHQAELVKRPYISSGGLEYFLSFEDSSREILYGFLRLRLSTSAGEECFPELRGAALIRELHVYGRLVRSEEKSSTKVQHIGMGKKLLQEAENISREHGFPRIAVISGVGVRTYYHDRGYVNLSREGQFQIKQLRPSPIQRMRSIFGYSLVLNIFVTVMLFAAIKLLVLRFTSIHV